MCSTMCIHAPAFNPSTPHCFFRQPISSPFHSSSRKLYNGVLRFNGSMDVQFSNGKKQRATVSASASVGQNSSIHTERKRFFRYSLTLKRKVVEHICLLKAKENLSEEEEKDMLDYLYTTQYQMRGIVAITLGRISDQNVENYTHAVYMRFQAKEDLRKFYENTFYLGVLREHVMPYCHGLTYVDFESEVEDDILPIFRKGEEFDYGVEFILLISIAESELRGRAEEALASLAKLILEFPSLIVQSVQGLNFCPSSKEYTHGVVIRFRSLEALELFLGSTEYKDIWRSKFQMIIQKTLSIHFSVDPVGTEIM